MKSTIKAVLIGIRTAFTRITWFARHRLYCLLTADVYFGRSPASVAGGSLVFFPFLPNVLGCGIAAIVSYKSARPGNALDSVAALDKLAKPIEGQGCQDCHKNDLAGLDRNYLGGKNLIESIWQRAQAFKGSQPFFAIYRDPNERRLLRTVGDRLAGIAETEEATLAERMGRIPTPKVELMAARIDKLKDIAW